MSNIDLNIYPIKDDSNDGYKLKTPVHPNLPDLERNFVMALIAPRSSGKTTLYTNLLLNPNFFNAPENIPSVYIFSPTINNDFTAKHIREYYKNSIYDRYDDNVIKDIITFQKSFPDDERPKALIVLDDSVGYKTNYLDSLITRARHWNVSVLVSVQATRHMAKVARSNVTDICLWKTYNKKEWEALYEEFGSLLGSKQRFQRIYNYATNQKYHFLYIKLDANPVRCFKNFSEEITNKFPQDEGMEDEYDADEEAEKSDESD
jgi:hypothetical protein